MKSRHLHPMLAGPLALMMATSGLPTAAFAGGGHAFLHTRQGARSGHHDVIMNYKTWDGSNWTARLTGGRFLHTRQGARSGHHDVIMNYKTWDGSNWTARLVPAGAAAGVTTAGRKTLSVVILGPDGKPVKSPKDLAPMEKLLRRFGLPPGTEALLLEAVRREVKKTDIRADLKRLHSDEVARIRVARHLLVLALGILEKAQRTTVEERFYKHFQQYYGRQMAIVAGQNHAAWRAYQQTAVLAQAAKGKTLSSLFYTGPTIKGFILPKAVFQAGRAGQAAIAHFVAPLILNDPDLAKDPTLAKLAAATKDRTLDIVLGAVGLAGGVVGGALLSFFASSLGSLAKIGIGALLHEGKYFVGAVVKQLPYLARFLPKVASEVVPKLAAKLMVLGGTAGTAAIGVLIVLPLLIDGAMKVADFVKTRQFGEKLKKLASNPDLNVDLHRMYLSNWEKSQGGCYAPCPADSYGNRDKCWQKCPAGYHDDMLTCRKEKVVVAKPSYGRGGGRPVSSCPPGTARDGALCYPACRPGFQGRGPVCWQGCPAGYADIGVSCRKPASYGRGAGYPWQFGDGFNLDNAKRRCQRANLQGCEQSGAIIYPRCRAGFHPVGCCTCSPTCPGGMPDQGAHCGKQSYGRGAGQAMRCAAHEEQSGAICYPRCRAGYRGNGPVCWGGCPGGYRDNGATCSRPPHIFGKQSRPRAGLPFASCPSKDARKRNRMTLVAYLVKMMVADPADGTSAQGAAVLLPPVGALPRSGTARGRAAKATAAKAATAKTAAAGAAAAKAAAAGAAAAKAGAAGAAAAKAAAAGAVAAKAAGAKAGKPPLRAIHLETPSAALHSKYHYSPRPAADAAKYGWKQLGVAFRVPRVQVPGTVAIYLETPAASPHSRYFYSTRAEADAKKNGWRRLGVAWYAYPKRVPGTVAIYLETPASAAHTKYYLSTRPEAQATKYGFKRLGVAFYAYPP